MSLLFSPPFDLAYVRESKNARVIRAPHIASARVALRHLDSWTLVRDAAGGSPRPGGRISALSVAGDAFVRDMLVLGWVVGRGIGWGSIAGWRLAARLGGAE